MSDLVNKLISLAKDLRQAGRIKDADLLDEKVTLFCLSKDDEQKISKESILKDVSFLLKNAQERDINREIFAHIAAVNKLINDSETNYSFYANPGHVLYLKSPIFSMDTSKKIITVDYNKFDINVSDLIYHFVDKSSVENLRFIVMSATDVTDKSSEIFSTLKNIADTANKSIESQKQEFIKNINLLNSYIKSGNILDAAQIITSIYNVNNQWIIKIFFDNYKNIGQRLTKLYDSIREAAEAESRNLNQQISACKEKLNQALQIFQSKQNQKARANYVIKMIAAINSGDVETIVASLNKVDPKINITGNTKDKVLKINYICDSILNIANSIKNASTNDYLKKNAQTADFSLPSADDATAANNSSVPKSKYTYTFTSEPKETNTTKALPDENVSAKPATKQPAQRPTNKKVQSDYLVRYPDIYRAVFNMQYALYNLGNAYKKQNAGNAEKETTGIKIMRTGFGNYGKVADGEWGQHTADALNAANSAEDLGLKLWVGPILGKEKEIGKDKIIEAANSNYEKISQILKSKFNIDMSKSQQLQKSQTPETNQTSGVIDSIKQQDLDELIEDGDIELNTSDLDSFQKLLNWGRFNNVISAQNPSYTYWSHVLRNLYSRGRKKPGYGNKIYSLFEKLEEFNRKMLASSGGDMKKYDPAMPISVEALDGKSSQQQIDKQGPTQNAAYQRYEGGDIAAEPMFPIQNRWIDVTTLRGMLSDNMSAPWNNITDSRIPITAMNISPINFYRTYFNVTLPALIKGNKANDPYTYIRYFALTAVQDITKALQIYLNKPNLDPDLARAARYSVYAWRNDLLRLASEAQRDFSINSTKPEKP